MAIERLNVGELYWRESGFSHIQRYSFAQPRLSGRVLDVACGVGYGSFIIGPFVESVLGVDVAADAIADAKSQHERPNVSFYQGTLESLPNSTPLFDAAVSLETIEHVPDPRAFLKEVRRRLRPNGTLVVSAPNALQHTRANPPIPNPFHVHEPTYEELCGWLADDFTIVEEWEQTRLIGPRYNELEPMARAGAAVSQYKVLRLAMWLERAVRRCCGKSLPAFFPVVRHSDELFAETAIIPLLPARRAVAHTFIFVARAKSTAT